MQTKSAKKQVVLAILFFALGALLVFFVKDPHDSPRKVYGTYQERTSDGNFIADTRTLVIFESMKYGLGRQEGLIETGKVEAQDENFYLLHPDKDGQNTKKCFFSKDLAYIIDGDEVIYFHCNGSHYAMPASWKLTPLD